MSTRFWQSRLFMAAAALLLVVIVGCGSKDEPQPDKKPAGNGKSAAKKAASDEADFFPLVLKDDFKMYPGDVEPDGVAWKQEGDVITCKGDPKGYLYTVELYENFTLRFDLKYPSPADEKKLNTGVLVYIGNEQKIWPISLEVQGKFAELGRVKANGGAPDPQIADNESARQQARHPAGEWNSVEVISKSGALSVKINGTVVCDSQPGTLKSGAIGFQAEGAEVQFRNVRIMVAETSSAPATASVKGR